MARYYNCKCGRKHIVGERCPIHNKFTKDNLTEEQVKYQKFYKSAKWIRKRDHIRKTDKVCQRCLQKHGIYTAENLEVHHINKLQSNWDKRFDADNLVTLCRTCHRQVDIGCMSGELDFDFKREEEEFTL